MERLQTPLRSGTQAYLTDHVMPALTDGLTQVRHGFIGASVGIHTSPKRN